MPAGAISPIAFRQLHHLCIDVKSHRKKNAAALPDGKPCVAEGLKFQQSPVTISLAHGKRKAPPAAAGFESSLCDLLHI
jgi:hypothetical protein